MLRFNPVVTALVVATCAASAASAQQPRRAMAPPQGGSQQPGSMGRPALGPPGIDVASMLLAQTAELKLTDQQVTRLAAIARRTGDRRTAMMASVDSLRAARMSAAGASGGAPGVVTRAPSPADRDMMVRMRDLSHADLRDALSVLTPEQLATSWELLAAHGGRGRMVGRGTPMGGMQGMQGVPVQPATPNPSGFRRNGVEPHPQNRPPA